MSTQELIETANALMAEGKGLLAMDESMPTIGQRFEKEGIPNTEENRRAYRELIVTTPGIGQCLSGAVKRDNGHRRLVAPLIGELLQSGPERDAFC